MAVLLRLQDGKEVRTAITRARLDGYVVDQFGCPFRWFIPVAEARLALPEGRIEDALQLFNQSIELGGQLMAEAEEDYPLLVRLKARLSQR